MDRSVNASDSVHSSVVSPPDEPGSQNLKDSWRLLKYGVESVNSLAAQYRRITKARGPGAPKHVEQDLLRAMLVMAGAALDATVKRIIHDALPVLISVSKKSKQEAAKLVQRQVLKDLDNEGGRLLSLALLDDQPRDRIVSSIIKETIGGSLQSLEGLRRVSALLGIDAVPDAENTIKNAFEARNQIVHEMDGILADEKAKRTRRQRRKDEMEGYASALINVGREILDKVDQVLKPPPRSQAPKTDEDS